MIRSKIGRTAWAAAAGAAVAASGGAAAQSSVTIYGALDAYVAAQSATGASSRKVLNSGFNPNALGFTGTEDLGGGMSAGFTLETQPVLDSGGTGQGGKMWGRQSLVFLGGSFGRVSLGRIHTAGRTFGIKYSATGWLTTDPLGNLLIAAGSAMAPVMNLDGAGSRTSNAVVYATPRMGGFSGSLMQSAGEGGTFAAGSAKLTQIGLGYTAGPLTADLVYNRIPQVPGSQIAQTDVAVGAQYAFTGVRVLGAYFSRKGSSVAAPGATTPIAGSEGTDRVFILGVSVPMGVHTFGASVGRLQLAEVHQGRRPANVAAPISGVADDATAWSLAYTYAFSKRTQAFVAYGALNNGDLGSASLVGDLRPTAGGTSRLLASGLRHSF
jgi:predicted porin